MNSVNTVYPLEQEMIRTRPQHFNCTEQEVIPLWWNHECLKYCMVKEKEMVGLPLWWNYVNLHYIRPEKEAIALCRNLKASVLHAYRAGRRTIVVNPETL